MFLFNLFLRSCPSRWWCSAVEADGPDIIQSLDWPTVALSFLVGAYSILFQPKKNTHFAVIITAGPRRFAPTWWLSQTFDTAIQRKPMKNTNSLKTITAAPSLLHIFESNIVYSSFTNIQFSTKKHTTVHFAYSDYITIAPVHAELQNLGKHHQFTNTY